MKFSLGIDEKVIYLGSEMTFWQTLTSGCPLNETVVAFRSQFRKGRDNDLFIVNDEPSSNLTASSNFLSNLSRRHIAGKLKRHIFANNSYGHIRRHDGSSRIQYEMEIWWLS
jgi:hypothetical protein